MNKSLKTFGTYFVGDKILKKIKFCRQLKNNWINKQMVQLIRKHVLKNTTLPLDLHIDGISLRCYITDNVCERNFVFMPWRYDVIERQQMLKCLPSDGVFIDIGANIGIYSTIASTHLSASGTVIAIEPNPPVYDRLLFNLNATSTKQKNPPTITSLMLGISDTESEIELYLDDKNLGASSIVVNKGRSIKIRCKTLLEIIREQKLARVDVIKCDIEGAEDQALIPYLISAPKDLLPQCIIFENNQQQWQGDLLKVLEETNYKLFAQTRLNFIYLMPENNQ